MAINSRSVRYLVAAAAVTLPGFAAMGSLLTVGYTYDLHNHPDGEVRQPTYGMRLDELYNATTSHDVFTFDFDHASSHMVLDYFTNSVRIHGVAYGGRDTGSGYANDSYRGVYTIDFTYTWGITNAPGDDDLLINPGVHYNYGSITTPLGDVFGLRDGHYSNGQPDFRLGNEDNDQGHRGFNGISGWGWLFFNNGTGYQNTASDDWLFTATLAPTPGSTALIGLGAIATMRRRRR